jgi:hypothetical protein
MRREGRDPPVTETFLEFFRVDAAAAEEFLLLI